MILIINAGSSSVKFQLFSQQRALPCLASGSVSDLGHEPTFNVTSQQPDQQVKQTLPINVSHEAAITFILDWVDQQTHYGPLSAITHRVVHGGTQFTSSVRITPNILHSLLSFIPLAPLHQQHNLAAIQLILTQRPDLMQIACFDTAFHAQHSPLFTACALPKTMREAGIRRYGFHGLSYEWIVHSLRQTEPTLAEGRLIAAHLGNGASLCAIHQGMSIDTTMGLTALDGLPMGTRCGQLDPGAIIYMIRNLGLSPDAVELMLYHQSGLLGLSEWTNDMRLLQTSEAPMARFAVDYFCLKTAQLMGMMAVAVGGVDGIIFTGGIGENSAVVRDKILAHLAWLPPFKTRIIPANEERIMALHTMAFF